jgi:hypothetical protein
MARATRLFSIVYFVAVAIVAIALALFGESWWPLTALLYVPRIAFAAPLFALVPANLLWRSWSGGAALVATGAIVVFPLMGLTFASAPTAHGQTLRLFSLNIYFARHGVPGILREIEAAEPDLILLQAMSDSGRVAIEKALAPRQVRYDREFLFATKFPITDQAHPPSLPSGEPPGFERYTVETPLGPLDVFNIHPYSPRAALSDLRGQGMRTTLLHGPSDKALAGAEHNTTVRRPQIEGL